MTPEIAHSWLVKEVADLKQINEFSTLRKSCLNYVESKLTPMVAFLLSKMDLYCNMDLLTEQSRENSSWMNEMWLSALNDEEIFKLSYEDMRINDTQRKEFECKQWPSGVRSDQLRARLPFFWIVINKLGDLCDNFFKNANTTRDMFLRTVPGLFRAAAQFRVFNKFMSPNVLDAYINDFLLVKSDLCNLVQMDIIKGILIVDEKNKNKTKTHKINFLNVF